MHYLNFLAEKLVSKIDSQNVRGAEMAIVDAERVKAVRSVLEREVEGGRLHYNVLSSNLEEIEVGRESCRSKMGVPTQPRAVSLQ